MDNLRFLEQIYHMSEIGTRRKEIITCTVRVESEDFKESLIRVGVSEVEGKT